MTHCHRLVEKYELKFAVCLTGQTLYAWNIWRVLSFEENIGRLTVFLL